MEESNMEQLSSHENETPDDYFGLCPVCHNTDGYLNVHQTHWFVCEKDRTCWSVGSNLFSDWKHETEDLWRQNAEEIASFQQVKPWFTPETLEKQRKAKEDVDEWPSDDPSDPSFLYLV